MERFEATAELAKTSNRVVIHAVNVGLAVVSQVITGVFFALTKENCVPNVLFQTSFKDVAETFPLEVTMDWWSGGYWVIIDLWTMAWLLGAVVSLFKRKALGPKSFNPEIHPPVFYLSWTIINIARMYTMFQWDRHNMLGAVMSSWILPILSFNMLYTSYCNLDRHKTWLAINSPSVIPWTRYLTQNSLAVFAWWSLLNAIVGLGMVLKYKAGVQDPQVSTLVLTLIFFCTITWFILQSFLLTKFLRYTFGVYAILVLGLGAMFTRSYRIHDLAANTVYCGFLMLVMTIMSVMHSVSECLSTNKQREPFTMEPYPTSGVITTVCQPEGNIKHKPQKW